MRIIGSKLFGNLVSSFIAVTICSALHAKDPTYLSNGFSEEEVDEIIVSRESYHSRFSEANDRFLQALYLPVLFRGLNSDTSAVWEYVFFENSLGCYAIRTVWYYTSPYVFPVPESSETIFFPEVVQCEQIALRSESNYLHNTFEERTWTFRGTWNVSEISSLMLALQASPDRRISQCLVESFQLTITKFGQLSGDFFYYMLNPYRPRIVMKCEHGTRVTKIPLDYELQVSELSVLRHISLEE